MSDKRRRKPEEIRVNGERYVLTVFRVRSTDGYDRPLACDRIDDLATVTITGGEEFMTAYIPAAMLRKTKQER